jgi:hypothetical protein
MAEALQNTQVVDVNEQTSRGRFTRTSHLLAVGATLLASATAGVTAISSRSEASAAAVNDVYGHIYDPNDVVCNGVQTLNMAEELAEGKADACGHKDIGEIWKLFGITPAVIKTMHSGVVYSNEGLISEGRDHSPDPKNDILVNLPVDGKREHIFIRDLAVFGDTDYDAWVGFTADGRLVAILKGCGNGETNHLPPQQPETAEVSVVKIAENPSREKIVTPSKTFLFMVQCEDGTTKIKRVALYEGGKLSDKYGQELTECNVGGQVMVRELPIQGWENVDEKATQYRIEDPNGDIFYFTDRQKKKCRPTTTTTRPTTTTRATTTTTTSTTVSPTTTVPIITTTTKLIPPPIPSSTTSTTWGPTPTTEGSKGASPTTTACVGTQYNPCTPTTAPAEMYISGPADNFSGGQFNNQVMAYVIGEGNFGGKL